MTLDGFCKKYYLPKKETEILYEKLGVDFFD